jgi:hypothetical protein
MFDKLFFTDEDNKCGDDPMEEGPENEYFLDGEYYYEEEEDDDDVYDEEDIDEVEVIVH